MSSDDESDWSDVPTDSPPIPAAPIYARAYQLEMFEQSMKQNTIVTMSTGSGKTLVAKMRIEAQLQKDSSKRVWFNAPNVDLAHQQYNFLSSQLPAYNFKLITGQDNASFWKEQKVWDIVLDNINVVVSTPQILLDALSNAMVSLKDISLLVFDEAHHCMSNAPMARIMNLFYHPMGKESPSTTRPSILGLTATSVTSQKSTNLKGLETNLDAICRAPTRHVEEYKEHVQLPRLKRLAFDQTTLECSASVQQLSYIVKALQIEGDPGFEHFSNSDNLADVEKRAKILRKGATPVMKQMKKLLGHATDLSENLGPGPSDWYLETCISKLRAGIRSHEILLESLGHEEHQYMSDKLDTVYEAISRADGKGLLPGTLSPKVLKLIAYLERQNADDVSIVIFVKRRSTAVVLTELLQSIPSLVSYRAFSFVGNSSVVKPNISDLANAEVQKQSFAHFRAGLQDICVATPAMEEGIDVPAINHVIRFDDPDTFRSYVQSRGRARKLGSSFVMMHPRDSSLDKTEEWRALEKEMVAQYMDARREINRRLEIEDKTTPSDDVYLVKSTGARLDFTNAPQRLQHFCQSLPHPGSYQPMAPIMMVEVKPDGYYAVRAILPSSLALELQDTPSFRAWRSEKMAQQDAAFQAYKKLHLSGLVNDNLLPPVKVKQERAQVEKRDIMYDVAPEINPWRNIPDHNVSWQSLTPLRIQVTCGEDQYEPLLLFVSHNLTSALSFPLFETTARTLTVTISPEHEMSLPDTHLAFEITKYLFTSMMRKGPDDLGIRDQLPFFLIPALTLDNLQSWFETNRNRKLTIRDFLRAYPPLRQPIVVYTEGHNRPFACFLANLCDTPLSLNIDQQNLVGRRITKRINYHSKEMAEQHSHQDVEMPVSSCHVNGLTASYGAIIPLMPSILFHFEPAMRAQLANQGPLRSLEFADLNMLTQALCTGSANHLNYERLEYLGDSLLNFFTSVQMFYDHPQANEGNLSLARDHVVNNARLQRATQSHGLAAYLTTTPMPGKWKFPRTACEDMCKLAIQRSVSSKTLGDVIESLIGATYLEGNCSLVSDRRVVSALKLFLPEICWRTPSDQIAGIRSRNHGSRIDTTKMAEIESSMLDYTFHDKMLLVEAFTSTNLGISTGCCSYERLEFLGDAVIGRIVKEEMHASNLEFGPGEMTRRSAAVLSHDFMAHLALQMKTNKSYQVLSTDAKGHTTMHDTIRTTHLVDFIAGTDHVVRQMVESAKEVSNQETSTLVYDSLVEDGRFPWSALERMGAPKICSDLIESVIGAVFVDSGGSLTDCRHVMGQLGMMAIVEVLASTRDVELRPPSVQLQEDFPRVSIRCKPKIKNGQIEYDAQALLDDDQISRIRQVKTRGQARTAAAEEALSILRTRNRHNAESKQE